jgi:membrane-associated phospholipid phosphatase
MLLVLKYRRFILFACLFPIYLALVFATVYIQAHYAIDVFAGWVSAVSFYFLGSFVYKLFTRRYQGDSELSAIFVKEKKTD